MSLYTGVVLPGDGDMEELHAQRQALTQAYHARDTLQRHRWGTQSLLVSLSPRPVFVASGFVMAEGTQAMFPSLDTFRAAVIAAVGCAQSGPCRSATRRRLHILEQKFDLFKALNEEVENRLVQSQGIQWEETQRVNIGVRAERCMPKADLIHALTTATATGEDPILQDLWNVAGLRVVSPETLGLMLGNTSGTTESNELDEFGLSRLRRPKSAGDVIRYMTQYSSKYLSELVTATLQKTSPCSITDLCINLTGATSSEWETLARFAGPLMDARPQVVFTARVQIDKVPDSVGTFEDVLLNIFRPFWDAETSTAVKRLLAHVESFMVFYPSETVVPMKSPNLYRSGEEVAPQVAMFYFWCNVQLLNTKEPHAKPRQFRFSCGSTTDIWMLAAAYLLSDTICNPVGLKLQPVLQYLCYLHDIGLVLSVLGHAARAGPAIKNFLKCGHLVTLCAEDPLQRYNHHDALLEEYTAARRRIHLTSMDLYEMSSNSLTISGRRNSRTEKSSSLLLSGRIAFRQMCRAHEHMIARGVSAITDTVEIPEPPNVQRDNAVRFIRIRTYNMRHMTPERPMGKQRQHDSQEAAIMLSEALRMRTKYTLLMTTPSSENPPSTSATKLQNHNGIWFVGPVPRQPDLHEFMTDNLRLSVIVSHPVVQHLAARRLKVLLSKYELHVAVNHDEEGETEGQHDHRDLYHTVKVDTHCHLAAGMTAKELLEFMKDQFINHGDDVVWSDNVTTLSDLQKRLKITDIEALTVDSLDVQADSSVWDRFDNFNSKYNPLGQSALREIFLKTDNAIKGRYFAEISKRVFRKSVSDGFIYSEFRVSIYGRQREEWSKLASWFATHGMASRANKFMVQIPRIYHVYRKAKELRCFADLLDNIFVPLWEVSINPASDPTLHNFLQHMSGFDSVDNEASLDYSMGQSASAVSVLPASWESEHNPPYWYWMFYLWANIRALNTFRASKRLSTFSFRPHCGESGATAHLVDGFLVATGVNHGITLRFSPTLQYLYYLSQIGIAMSPLSNNSIFLTYTKNPFPIFFKRGLNVSLSTDDPLQFHHTSEPLIEEYSIAAKMWRLSATDLCEIARYSVLQSGFDDARKAAWLGPLYHISSSQGNVPQKSHVPNIRVAFRFETYHDECNYLMKLMMNAAGTNPIPRAMKTLQEEALVMQSRPMSNL